MSESKVFESSPFSYLRNDHEESQACAVKYSTVFVKFIMLVPFTIYIFTIYKFQIC